jgi:amino acid transporter
VGYKIDHGGGSFGSAIDCVVAAVALSALIVAFALSAGAPGTRVSWWGIAVSATFVLAVTFAVFRGAKRVGDRMIERDRDERGDGF